MSPHETGVDTPDSTLKSPIRVAMIVPNTVLLDTRVMKSASSLASAGLQVTVLGLKFGGDEESIEQDGWSIRIIPFSNIAQSAATERANSAARDTRSQPTLQRDRRLEGAIHRELKADRMMIENRRREAAAEIGWARDEAHKSRRERALDLVSRKEAAVAKLTVRSSRVKAAARRMPRPLGSVVYRGNALVRLPYRVTRVVHRWLARQPATDGRREQERIRRRLQTDEDEYAQHRRHLLDELAAHHMPPASATPQEHPWREQLPFLHDFEAALGPVLDSLDADVIHVHDFPLLGVGARAKGRALRRGKRVRLIYDAHEYLAGIRYGNPATGVAWLSLEREYLRHADYVITVSDPIAERIQSDYALANKPAVVLNTPMLAERSGQAPNLRKLAGVSELDRVIVYSGNLQPERNAATVVRALPLMPPDVHFVVVCNAVTPAVEDFLRLGNELGVADRVHLVPYVDVKLVPEYLSSADLAVHPMTSDSLNHQLALPNKVFEYLHAGLPELVSDNPVMAAFVSDNGIGESFRATDEEDLAEKADLMLNDIDRYRSTIRRRSDLIDRYCWSAQIPPMLSAYDGLLEASPRPAAASTGQGQEDPDDGRPSVVFLPTNTAGQAWGWAKALESRYEGVQTEVVVRERMSSLSFDCDRQFSADDAGSPQFRLAELSGLLEKTHAVVEGGQSPFGSLPSRGYWDDLPLYDGAGVAVALVFHGSDIRDPDRHADLVGHSPFREDSLHGMDSDLMSRIRTIAHAVADRVQEFGGPVFVSTPDLTDYLPHALWLPQVVDLRLWKAAPIRLGERRLRVVMIPTSNVLKGSAYAEAVCWRLHNAELIQFQSLSGLPHREMVEAVARADVVIDGLVLGAYGTTAVESMASQRLVICNVERTVDSVERLPIVHADPDTLESTLREIVESPGRFRSLAEQGREFVEQYHDGSYSTAQLARFLDLEPEGSSSSF